MTPPPPPPSLSLPPSPVIAALCGRAVLSGRVRCSRRCGRYPGSRGALRLGTVPPGGRNPGGPRNPSCGLCAPARPVAAPQPRAMHPGCSRSPQPAAIFPRPVATPQGGLRCAPSRCDALQLHAVALTRCSPPVLCSASWQPAAPSARCSAPRLLVIPSGPLRYTQLRAAPQFLAISSLLTAVHPSNLQSPEAVSVLAHCNAPQSLTVPLTRCRPLSFATHSAACSPPVLCSASLLLATPPPRPIQMHSSCMQAPRPIGIPPGPLQPLSSLQHTLAVCHPPNPLQSLHPMAVHLECALRVTHRAGEHHPKSIHPAQCQPPAQG